MFALQEFVKEGADERIMPPWTLQELEAALPLFPSVSLARLHELYSMWGGVVRWVLARANRAGNEGYLEKAIARSNLDALQAAVGRSDAAEEVSCKGSWIVEASTNNHERSLLASVRHLDACPSIIEIYLC